MRSATLLASLLFLCCLCAVGAQDAKEGKAAVTAVPTAQDALALAALRDVLECHDQLAREYINQHKSQ